MSPSRRAYPTLRGAYVDARPLLILQVVVFAGAALMHAGILLHGHQHNAARNAETIIAIVLLVGLVSTILAPESNRAIARLCRALRCWEPLSDSSRLLSVSGRERPSI
jgi:hypothetical protein